MPLYEYTCDQCSTTFEELVASASSTPTLHCPACKSTKVRKLVSTFASRVGSESRTADSAPSCESGNCCLNGNCGL